jgi:hypothetical protein
VIQIDVHSAGKTRPTRHTHPMLSPPLVPDYMYLAWSTHSNLLRSPHEVEIGPTLEEILATTDRLARPSPWVTSSFLPHDRLSIGERGFSQVVTKIHRFTGPIYQHVIGTFNTCSRGPTHWSFTNTGGGYNHLRAPLGLGCSIST